MSPENADFEINATYAMNVPPIHTTYLPGQQGRTLHAEDCQIPTWLQNLIAEGLEPESVF